MDFPQLTNLLNPLGKLTGAAARTEVRRKPEPRDDGIQESLDSLPPPSPVDVLSASLSVKAAAAIPPEVPSVVAERNSSNSHSKNLSHSHSSVIQNTSTEESVEVSLEDGSDNELPIVSVRKASTAEPHDVEDDVTPRALPPASSSDSPFTYETNQLVAELTPTRQQQQQHRKQQQLPIRRRSARHQSSSSFIVLSPSQSSTNSTTSVHSHAPPPLFDVVEQSPGRPWKISVSDESRRLLPHTIPSAPVLDHGSPGRRGVVIVPPPSPSRLDTIERSRDDEKAHFKKSYNHSNNNDPTETTVTQDSATDFFLWEERANEDNGDDDTSIASVSAQVGGAIMEVPIVTEKDDDESEDFLADFLAEESVPADDDNDDDSKPSAEVLVEAKSFPVVPVDAADTADFLLGESPEIEDKTAAEFLAGESWPNDEKPTATTDVLAEQSSRPDDTIESSTADILVKEASPSDNDDKTSPTADVLTQESPPDLPDEDDDEAQILLAEADEGGVTNVGAEKSSATDDKVVRGTLPSPSSQDKDVGYTGADETSLVPPSVEGGHSAKSESTAPDPVIDELASSAAHDNTGSLATDAVVKESTTSLDEHVNNNVTAAINSLVEQSVVSSSHDNELGSAPAASLDDVGKTEPTVEVTALTEPLQVGDSVAAATSKNEPEFPVDTEDDSIAKIKASVLVGETPPLNTEEATTDFSVSRYRDVSDGTWEDLPIRSEHSSTAIATLDPLISSDDYSLQADTSAEFGNVDSTGDDNKGQTTEVSTADLPQTTTNGSSPSLRDVVDVECTTEDKAAAGREPAENVDSTTEDGVEQVEPPIEKQATLSDSLNEEEIADHALFKQAGNSSNQEAVVGKKEPPSVEQVDSLRTAHESEADFPPTPEASRANETPIKEDASDGTEDIANKTAETPLSPESDENSAVAQFLTPAPSEDESEHASNDSTLKKPSSRSLGTAEVTESSTAEGPLKKSELSLRSNKSCDPGPQDSGEVGPDSPLIDAAGSTSDDLSSVTGDANDGPEEEDVVQESQESSPRIGIARAPAATTKSPGTPLLSRKLDTSSPHNTKTALPKSLLDQVIQVGTTTPTASPTTMSKTSMSGFSSPFSMDGTTNRSKRRLADYVGRDLWRRDDTDVVLSALQEIATAAQQPEARSSIARTGGLLGIVRALEDHHESIDIQVAGCRALELLALDAENEIAIAEVGGMDVIFQRMVCHYDNATVHEAAWSCLWNLTCLNAAGKLSLDRPGGMHALVDCMKRHLASPGVQKNACGALTNLCLNNEGRLESLVEAGGLAAITAALQTHWTDEDVRRQASFALHRLLESSAQGVLDDES